MKIAVCVKRVPATETRVKVTPSGDGIESEGVKYIQSPYDEFAVEGALRAREAAGEGEVSLVTFGQDGAAETLRSGLAMGADSAVLLRGDSEVDGLTTAKVLAGWFARDGSEKNGTDASLILLGVKAADHDQQQVGPMLGVLLDRPCVTGVVSFEVDGDVVRCEREVEGGIEVVEAELPAVITVTKGEYEPRYASLRGIVAARRKPLDTYDVDVETPGLVIDRLHEPPPRPPGRIVGEGAEAVPELVRLLREEAHAL